MLEDKPLEGSCFADASVYRFYFTGRWCKSKAAADRRWIRLQKRCRIVALDDEERRKKLGLDGYETPSSIVLRSLMCMRPGSHTQLAVDCMCLLLFCFFIVSWEVSLFPTTLLEQLLRFPYG